jgi:membrane-bound lytic murein transglycosylase D
MPEPQVGSVKMSAKPLATVLLAFSIAGCAQVPTQLDAAFGNESTSHKASSQSGGRTAAAMGTGAVGSTATQSEGASTPSGVAGTGWNSAGLTGMSAVISVPLEGGEISPGQMAAPSTEAPAEIAVPPQVAGPAAPATIWDRVRSGFVLAPMENDLVREWENWYATRPDYVARMIDRSSRFMFHILEEVEKRRMPTEIALLPMIESAYNPVAYSTAHASGIWQFIPSTGRDFGLRQNWWYDGRRDVIAATTAALDYLEKLYGMFGDWPLALASYNWGEGSVSRAIARNRARGLPTDYQSLTMPSETRSYLPKLIAVKNIIANPARYGLEIANVPNEPFFETVTLRRHIDLKLAAKLAEMSVQDFKFLNPGHSKPVIRSGEAERIVLPRDKVALFRSNFEQHDRPLVSWQAVTVRAGQKPERIAADHGMTLAELKTVNGLENKRIVTGQPLLVPLKENAGEPQLPDMPAQAVTLPKAIQAAKNAAKTLAARRDAARVAAQKPAQRALIQRAQAGKERKGTTQQLRAEQGKRVKVVESRTTSRKSADKSPQPQRMRVASRD